MATIIKPQSREVPSGVPTRGVAYNLADMASQADDYLHGVRREAAKIVDQARRDAEAVRVQAETAGRRAAEQAIDRILDEKVAKQMQTLAPALAAAVAQIQDAKHDWQRQWEGAAVGLAVAMAERIVRKELAARPEISLDWVREALELAAPRGEITVHLHPGDHQSLGKQVEQLCAVFRPVGEGRVVAATDVSPGGCRVTTEFGAVDMQLDSQLARLAEELAS